MIVRLEKKLDKNLARYKGSGIYGFNDGGQTKRSEPTVKTMCVVGKKPIWRWGPPIRKSKTAASRLNCAVDERGAPIGHSCESDVNNNNVQASRSAALDAGKRWKQGGSNIWTRRRCASCVCVRKCVKCVVENNISSRPAGPSPTATTTMRRGTTPWPPIVRVRECSNVCLHRRRSVLLLLLFVIIVEAIV